MDSTAVAIAGAAFTAAVSVLTPWLKARGRRPAARAGVRWEEAGYLPPGSRVVDLGRHGLVIDVGGTVPAPGASRDPVR
jgi:hypothetical protein